MGRDGRTALVLDPRSGPALAVARSLGRAGWHVYAQTGGRVAASRYVEGLVDLPSSFDASAQFATAAVDVLGRGDFDVVIPCSDATLLALSARESDLGGARIMGGDIGWTDKVEGLRRAEAVGFPTPEWVAPVSREEAREAVAHIGFPCVVKPRLSYVEAGGRLVQRRLSFVTGPQALEPALDTLAEPDGSLPVIQAYVPGRSIAAGAVVSGGKILAAAARETLTFDPLRGGTSVWKRSVPLDEPGVQEALDLLTASGYDGVGEVEFQLDHDGVPRFMEVSARLFAWIGLAVAAGVDLPLVAAQALMHDPVTPTSAYVPGTQMRWPAGEVRRLRSIASRDPGLPPGVSRSAALRRIWPPWTPSMRYDGLTRDDPGPWLPGRSRREAAKPMIRPERG
jgi:predicted ATP-grasp superfamily ATP-dependent carboligase